MIEALVDTNIVVDVSIDRPPHSLPAQALWQKVGSGEFRPYVSAVTVMTIFYLISKAADETIAKAAVVDLLKDCQVLTVDRAMLEKGLQKNWDDFEDAVQDAVAESAGLAIIVTRDPVDFARSTRRIVDAATIVQEIDQTSSPTP